MFEITTSDKELRVEQDTVMLKSNITHLESQ